MSRDVPLLKDDLTDANGVVLERQRRSIMGFLLFAA